MSRRIRASQCSANSVAKYHAKRLHLCLNLLRNHRKNFRGPEWAINTNKWINLFKFAGLDTKRGTEQCVLPKISRLCTFLKAGAILFVTVPATMMQSACRGLARNTTPKRSMSYLGAAKCIISTAQHAKPRVSGHSELCNGENCVTCARYLQSVKHARASNPRRAEGDVTKIPTIWLVYVHLPGLANWLKRRQTWERQFEICVCVCVCWAVGISHLSAPIDYVVSSCQGIIHFVHRFLKRGIRFSRHIRFTRHNARICLTRCWTLLSVGYQAANQNKLQKYIYDFGSSKQKGLVHFGEQWWK